MKFLGEIIKLCFFGKFNALNKETKNKAPMLKMQLTTEQRVFVVKTYYKTSSYLEVKEGFHRSFQRKNHQQIGQYGKT